MSTRHRFPGAHAASVAAVAMLLSLASCRRDTQDVRGAAIGDRTLPQRQRGVVRAADTTGLPAEGALARVAIGDMNCAACHGYDLKGGMGPDLTDTYWRYGGSPADIYKSIFEGRPQGMPAWGRSIPSEYIWKVVAYIQSKGGSYPAALADRGRQGDLADEDTTAGSTLKGRNNVH